MFCINDHFIFMVIRKRIGVACGHTKIIIFKQLKWYFFIFRENFENFEFFNVIMVILDGMDFMANMVILAFYSFNVI
jgi:hypothetical protein